MLKRMIVTRARAAQIWRALCDSCRGAGPHGGLALLLHGVFGLLECQDNQWLLSKSLPGHVLLHGSPSVNANAAHGLPAMSNALLN